MRPFLRDLGGRDPYEILQVPRNATMTRSSPRTAAWCAGSTRTRRPVTRTLRRCSTWPVTSCPIRSPAPSTTVSQPRGRPEALRQQPAGPRRRREALRPAAAPRGRGRTRTSACAAARPNSRRPGTGRTSFTGAVRSPNAYWRAEEPTAAPTGYRPPVQTSPGYHIHRRPIATSGLPAPSRAGPAPSRAGPAATRRRARRDRAGLLVRLHADRPDPRHRRLRPVSA